MIHPFLPLPIFGIIWYQGESNDREADIYACAVREMVEDWRAQWFQETDGQTDPLFPFGQCQVSMENLGMD